MNSRSRGGLARAEEHRDPGDHDRYRLRVRRWGLGRLSRRLWRRRIRHGVLDESSVQRIPIGALTVAIFDPKINQLVWRGEANAEIAEGTTSQQAIQDVVGQLFAQFPPKPGQQPQGELLRLRPAHESRPPHQRGDGDSCRHDERRFARVVRVWRGMPRTVPLASPFAVCLRCSWECRPAALVGVPAPDHALVRPPNSPLHFPHEPD